jgi:hypothetical protein
MAKSTKTGVPQNSTPKKKRTSTPKLTKREPSLVMEHSGPSIFQVAHYVHEEYVAECSYCGRPMNRSEINDYGSLCETCYMEEYYGK